MGLDHDVRALKDQITAAQGKRAGHEHQQRVAEAARDQALQQIQSEFGVQDVKQAQALLVQLEADAAAECKQVEADLAVAEDGL
jgi:hypothetical protein